MQVKIWYKLKGTSIGNVWWKNNSDTILHTWTDHSVTSPMTGQLKKKGLLCYGQNSIKRIVFWDAVSCSLAEIYWYWCSSETSANFYLVTTVRASNCCFMYHPAVPQIKVIFRGKAYLIVWKNMLYIKNDSFCLQS